MNVKKDYHKGYLLKWTNYLRGYQKRWFVVSNGLLSYYRNQHEVSHACRGTINLATATIKVHDTHNIILSNEGNQTFHLRTFTPEDTNQWTSALMNAKKTAIRLSESVLDDDSDCDRSPKIQFNNPLINNASACNISLNSCESSPKLSNNTNINPTREFDLKLYDLKNSVNLVKKNSDGLLGLLKQLNTSSLTTDDINCSDAQINDDNSSRLSLTAANNVLVSTNKRSVNNGIVQSEIVQKIKDKNKLFSVSAQACVNSCGEFVSQIQSLQTFYQKQLNIEREQRLRLENMVEELAKQLGVLEKRAAKKLDNDVPFGVPHSKDLDDSHKSKSVEPNKNEEEDSDNDHFYDAVEDEHMFNVSLPRAISPQNSLNIEPKYMQNEYESCGSSDYESEQENIKSKSIARVIVRQNKKSPKKSTKKIKGSFDLKKIGKGHRRAVSSGCDLQSNESKKFQGQFSSFRANSTEQKSSDMTSSGLEYSTSTIGEIEDSSNLYKSTKETQDLMKSAQSVPYLGPDIIKKPVPTRRDRITIRPNISVNLWGIMKNCLGKDLTKIPMPVNFNEPLSMLQRLTEDLEYSQCLDEAANCTDPIEQLARVAAFTVSSYSTTTTRTGKPFNPLLGETFECDRTADEANGGWRSLAEQVSHHPPAAALYAESLRNGWKCWQEFTMSSKFRGKYLAIIPLGIAHLTFDNSSNHYTWRKVTSTVHNIVVGKLWIDNHGEMDIYNHATGDTCHLNYKAYSYFSREPARKVTGVITDKHGVTRYVLNGTWDEYFEGAKVLEIRRDKNNQQIFETAPTKTLWKRNYPPDYTSEMYNFTNFALTLNEPEPGVAPTDSRLRPDQRLMEDGQWDDANKVKERLEDKQREKRRQRERDNDIRKREGQEPLPEHKPAWFEQTYDDTTKQPLFKFNEKYWTTKESGDWNQVELTDIF